MTWLHFCGKGLQLGFEIDKNFSFNKVEIEDDKEDFLFT